MRAVLLAGGKGTRLYPYTSIFPKPLVPLGDKPVLEILIRRLKKSGFNHITLCVGHLAYMFQAFFRNGEWLDVNIDYSSEEIPLGTVGPVSNIEDLPELFLVANGDLLTDVDFEKMMIDHKKKKALLTIGVYKRTEKVELGVLETKRNKVIKYLEKPSNTYIVSAGVYIFDKRIMRLIPKNQYMDFPALVSKLIKKKAKINSYNIDGFWLDIGRPDDYQKAIEIYTSKKDIFQ